MDATFVYNKIITLQPPCVVDCFASLFALEVPDTVIEIGTAHGGLTMILYDSLGKKSKTTIHTFDLNRGKFLEDRITRHAVDVLSPEGQKQIGDLILAGGKVLLLCDGGNKIAEFNTFAPKLKSGDIIMAHDYAGRSCLDWIWVEIADRDIAATVASEKLETYHQETMGKAAWVSFKKK